MWYRSPVYPLVALLVVILVVILVFVLINNTTGGGVHVPVPGTPQR
jgi:hypothetical protein